jgi:biopolymer transport protein ExbB
LELGTPLAKPYNTAMPNLLANGSIIFAVAAEADPVHKGIADLIGSGGPMLWVIFFAGAAGIVIFIERALHCHRAQINSTEFLNGVRTVIKRDNVVEAISICDATPGPVARLVKVAILNRDHGRDRVREALEEAGLSEVPRLEQRLDLLATIAQLAPLMGLLGTVLGFIKSFTILQGQALYANSSMMTEGVGQALICCAVGLAVAIPIHAGYNYLVSRVNTIVTDMERAANEIVNIVTENGRSKSS